jgi:alpha-L-fucosidase 2
MDAVHSMLLQSQNGLLSIFPACPKAWSDVSFERLHAEGGFVVSASRSGGRTLRLGVRSTRGGTLRLVDPFPGRDATWSVPFTRDGDTLLFDTQPGQSIQATI